MPNSKTKMYALWTKEEENLLRQNVTNSSDEEIANMLLVKFGRKIGASGVARKRRRMGIKKAPGRGIRKVIMTRINRE
jgi:hypothetical protein